MKHWTAIGVATAVFLVGAAKPIEAVPLTGGFGTTSSGVMTFNTALGDVKIDFCPPDPFSPVIGTPTCSLGGPTPGVGLLVAQGGTGTFAGIVAPVGGTIKDMVDSPNPVYNPFTYVPVGVSGLAVNNFLTLNPFPLVNFQLNELVAQTCAPSATSICSGAFVATQVGSSVSASFTLNGTLIAPGFDATPFEYVVSTQFANTTIGAWVAQAGATTGVFGNTWSGSLNALQPGAPVPEPATFTLLAFGLAGVGRRYWRRAARTNRGYRLGTPP